jgi:hypothetical protein
VIGMRTAASALLAALLLLAGCAPATPPAGRTATPQLTVALVQNRSDGPVGRLQLRVTNGSREDLRVDTATLESTALAAPAVWDKGTTIPAGATRDLPVRFPGASCADGEPETVVRVEVATAAGEVRVDVSPTDPNARLPLLTDTDCFAQGVAAVGEVALAALHAADAPGTAELEVRVDSAGGDGTLQITSIQSTTLFTPLDADGSPATAGPVGLELRPGESSATARVPIVPNRCDPHALAEDKIGTLFVFAAELQGGPSGSLTVPASPELRGDLYDYFTRACGL